MARNLTTGLQRGLRRSIAGGLGTSDLFSVASLDLRFAQQKTLDPRITFTRASSGTYVGSDGLIKTATTNLLLRSEEFSNTAWTSTSSANIIVTADQAISPTGTTTADRVQGPSGGTGTTYFQQTYATTAGANASYTFSIYLRSNTGVNQTLRLKNTHGGVLDNFSSNITVTTSWQRFSFTVTNGASAGTSQIGGLVCDTSNNAFDVLAWGAQLEQSSTVGEYIPTTSTINSAPRFDHNPTTGESLGLLVEEQRTNLLLRSEEFGTWWTALRASVSANATTSPSGSLTADTVIEDTTATNSHQIYSGSAQGAGTYTVSIYAKAAGRSVFQIQQESGGNSRFTLTGNGTAEALGANTVSITSVGNGWYRCTSTYTATGAHLIYLVLHNGTTTFYTGDGVSGIHFWGAMLESGSFPTSYIPTTTATVTRSADVASITGANFSSWYNQTEGTVFAETQLYSTSARNAAGFDINDNSTNNRAIFRAFTTGSGDQLTVRSGGSTVAIISSASAPLATSRKTAIALKADAFAITTLGSAAVEDTSGAVPVAASQILVGSAQSSIEFLGGTIRRLTYWPSRLPNATLQQITR